MSDTELATEHNWYMHTYHRHSTALSVHAKPYRKCAKQNIHIWELSCEPDDVTTFESLSSMVNSRLDNSCWVTQHHNSTEQHSQSNLSLLPVQKPDTAHIYIGKLLNFSYFFSLILKLNLSKFWIKWTLAGLTQRTNETTTFSNVRTLTKTWLSATKWWQYRVSMVHNQSSPALSSVYQP